MLNISTKTDYALMIMIELAKSYKLGYLSLSKIATKMNVSASYLTQIAQFLIKAGLVDSKEGKFGGLKLAKSAKSISVLNVLEAIDENIGLKCIGTNSKKCPSINQCGAKSAWLIITNDLKKILTKKKLSSFVSSVV